MNARYALTQLATLAAAALLISTLGTPAKAVTETASNRETMKIDATCIALGGVVTFPDYPPNSTVAVTANGSGAAIQCNISVPWSVTTDAGLNSNHATGTCGSSRCSRAMADGAGHYIGYELFDGPCCNVSRKWNQGGPISGTGNGQPQAIVFWGMVAPSQNVAAGRYADIVTATYKF